MFAIAARLVDTGDPVVSRGLIRVVPTIEYVVSIKDVRGVVTGALYTGTAGGHTPGGVAIEVRD